MSPRTSDFQGAEQVRKVRPTQDNAEPAPPPYVGGGRCGAAPAPEVVQGAECDDRRFDVTAFEQANKRAFLRLAEFAAGDDELYGFLTRALLSLSRDLRPAPKRAAPKLNIVEGVSRSVRDHRRDEICLLVSRSTGEDRRALFLEAALLHSAAEKAARRKVLIRLWRDRYGKGSANRMVAQIMDDQSKRRSYDPKTTGEPERDQLIDKILACRFDLSHRTITEDLKHMRFCKTDIYSANQGAA